MKKEYIAPTVEVVEMEVTHMLAVSDKKPIGGDPNEDFGDDGFELSNRRRNFWDEVGRGW